MDTAGKFRLDVRARTRRPSPPRARWQASWSATSRPNWRANGSATVRSVR